MAVDANCCAGLVFRYGTYEHPAGECYPAAITFERKRSSRNLRYATLVRFVINGSLVGCTTAAEVELRMQDMIEAYALDYEDAGFYYSVNPDVPTAHVMTNSPQDEDPPPYTNLSGVQVTYRSWDDQFATELANTRSFTIIIESTYLDYYSSILEYRETVTRNGTGGQKWKMVDNWDLEPIKELVQPQTSIKIVQQGRIVGVNGYIAPPTPLYGIAYEHEEQRVITYGSPKAMGHMAGSSGNWTTPDEYIAYLTEYKYSFELTKAEDTNPGKPPTWPS